VTISNFAGTHVTLTPGLATQVDVSFNWQLPNTVEIIAGPGAGAAQPVPVFVQQQPVVWHDPSGNPFGTYSNPLSSATCGTHLEVVPVVTASSYTSGYVIGGILHFTNILPPSLMGKLDTIELIFTGTTQTIEFDVAVFNGLPVGTFADHGAPVINALDHQYLLDVFSLTLNRSPLGTHTIYTLNGINKRIVGRTQDLWAVVVCKGGAPVAPASTSELRVRLGVSF
jgi:hypothetical protein